MPTAAQTKSIKMCGHTLWTFDESRTNSVCYH